MMHDRAEGEALPYTHEFLSHMLGANRKSADSPKVGKSPFDWNCVVADAVYVERVSATKFPANREINRENREIGSGVSNAIIT
jgi:hypothetical protein